MWAKPLSFEHQSRAMKKAADLAVQLVERRIRSDPDK